MEEIEKENGNPEVQNPAHLLAKKLQENRRSLHIARIPDKTKEAFISLAESEFCGDYGMALKWLIDDIPGQDTRLIVAKLEEIEARLQALESTTNKSEDKPDENTRTMLDGKKKAIRRSEKNE